MITSSENVRTIENMGLIDRSARFLIGGGGLAYFIFYTGLTHPIMMMASQVLVAGLCVYLIMTAMIGWEPLYAVFSVKSCSLSGRNQCGSLPYQVMALLGRSPKYCETDSQHSLEACHNDPQELPLHKLWKVEQTPMLYPSDAVLDAYVERQERKERIKLHREKAA